MKYNRTSLVLSFVLANTPMESNSLMLTITNIIIVSPNWRKVLKLFRQTEVRCAIGESGDRQR